MEWKIMKWKDSDGNIYFDNRRLDLIFGFEEFELVE
jgi:hypothetical protein